MRRVALGMSEPAKYTNCRVRCETTRRACFVDVEYG